MIKSLSLKNYQSHRDTLLEFDEGVNVIFGVSLHGKTAVIRGLNLLLNNRPSGAKYFSNFAGDKGETEIQCILAEGDRISIRKIISKDKKTKAKVLDDTVYLINGQKFSSIGKNVPDEVVWISNMTDLNIQKQFDQPFLIIGSAGEFAKTINRVTKLDKPDDWVSELTRRINETNRETKLLEGQAKEIEIEVARYEGFEELEKQSKHLTEVLKELSLAIEEADKIDSCLDRIEDADAELKKIKPALEIENDILTLTNLEGELKQLERHLELVERLVKIDGSMRGLQEILDLSEQVVAGLELEEQLARLKFSIKELEKKEESVRAGKALLSNMEQMKKFLETEDDLAYIADMIRKIGGCDADVENNEVEYSKLKSEYVSTLKRDKKCPTCFVDIDAKTIDRVEKSL